MAGDTLTGLFASILELPAEELSDDTSPKNTAQWDSMANMMLLSAIEETWEIELSTAEIDQMRSIGATRAVLQAHGVAEV